MADHDNMFDLPRKTRMSAEITYLMLKGAGWAALVFFGTWIGIAILAWIGTLLPERSRETPDPNPLSELSVPWDGDPSVA